MYLTLPELMPAIEKRPLHYDRPIRKPLKQVKAVLHGNSLRPSYTYIERLGAYRDVLDVAGVDSRHREAAVLGAVDVVLLAQQVHVLRLSAQGFEFRASGFGLRA